MVVQSYEDMLKYVHRGDLTSFTIEKGLVPNMRTTGRFYVNEKLEKLMFQEYEAVSGSGVGFLPAMTQIANVSALPGIVGSSIALPDVHAGYGFSIGNVAACKFVSVFVHGLISKFSSVHS